jgi:hypothetical protein
MPTTVTGEPFHPFLACPNSVPLHSLVRPFYDGFEKLGLQRLNGILAARMPYEKVLF